MKVGTIEKILIKCDDLAALRDSLKFGDEKLTCSRAIRDLAEVLIADGLTDWQLDKTFDHAERNRWSYEWKCGKLRVDQEQADREAAKAAAI
jgi:hypothetical protein